jgi:hypothetical protein
VPAAAVIPAPIAYIKFAAVKASVVEFRVSASYMSAMLTFWLLTLFVDGLPFD